MHKDLANAEQLKQELLIGCRNAAELRAVLMLSLYDEGFWMRRLVINLTDMVQREPGRTALSWDTLGQRADSYHDELFGYGPITRASERRIVLRTACAMAPGPYKANLFEFLELGLHQSLLDTVFGPLHHASPLVACVA